MADDLVEQRRHRIRDALRRGLEIEAGCGAGLHARSDLALEGRDPLLYQSSVGSGR